MSAVVTLDICDDCGRELPEARIVGCGACGVSICEDCERDHRDERHHEGAETEAR